MAKIGQFGVEIEAFNIDSETLYRSMEKIGEKLVEKNGISKYWKLEDDGSLIGRHSFELVSPILHGRAGINNVKRVLDMLKKNGARIDRSCSMHVHIDAKGLLKKSSFLKYLIARYGTFEREIDESGALEFSVKDCEIFAIINAVLISILSCYSRKQRTLQKVISGSRRS